MHLGQAARAALAALALTTVAACSTAVRTPGPAPSEDASQEASAPTTVDPGLLARGSFVAVVEHRSGAGEDAAMSSTSLEVVTADGERHVVRSWPGEAELVDWRPDLHAALVRLSPDRRGADRVESYDVTTGETHAVRLPRTVMGVGLDPTGGGVVVTRSVGRRPATQGQERVIAPVRLTWSGRSTRLPGTAGAEAIGSVDAGTLVVPANVRPAWWVHDAATGRARSFDTPGTCSPVRWIGPETVLAGCYADGGNRLTAIGLDGTSTPVGARHRVPGASRSATIADVDRRSVGGVTCTQSYDARPDPFSLTCRRGGRTEAVGLEGLPTLTRLVGARGGRLVVTGAAPDGRQVLALADPARCTTTTLVRLADDEEWQRVVDATEVRAWGA